MVLIPIKRTLTRQMLFEINITVMRGLYLAVIADLFPQAVTF